MMSKKKTIDEEKPAEAPGDAPEHVESQDDAALNTEEAVADAPNAEVDNPPAPEEKSEEDILKDRLLRLQADFDNFRKRTARERMEWQAYATEQLLQDLLPVVDHYEMGLTMAEKQDVDKGVMDGLRLVYDQFLSVFKKQGVEQLTAEPGAAFDPHLHEAISHVPSEEHPADVIIAETRRGYKQGEKLIRPLQVVVSSGPGAPSKEESTD